MVGLGISNTAHIPSSRIDSEQASFLRPFVILYGAQLGNTSFNWVRTPGCTPGAGHDVGGDRDERTGKRARWEDNDHDCT